MEFHTENSGSCLVSLHDLAPPVTHQAPVLYNGGRSGEIFSIDLRQRARRGHGWKACRFYQESAITSVHVLQDENYLIAADMKGTVCRLFL